MDMILQHPHQKVHTFYKMGKIIIISAHPDDEILGAGGTLLKHKADSHDLA